MGRTKLTNMLETHMNRSRESNRDKYMIGTVERTRKFLNQNKDIIILNADKGNVTVAMNKNDYKERMSNLLSDMMTYQRINKDPTSNLQKKNNDIVEELFKNNIISTIEKKRLKTEIAIAPRIYGLPKIHKDGYPLRPICSSINSPSIKLCKYIVNILNNLTTKSVYNVRDSVQFRDKIKNLTVNNNEKMVSFDVVSLFPSIPVELGLNIIEERWEEIEQYTNITKDMFLNIVKFCIKDNRYFKFDDKIYKQKAGLPMGSPASPIIADLVMESLLNESLQRLQSKPKILTKYVDDLFLIIREDAIQETLTVLNSFNKNIKFTLEEECDGKIPYLDTLVIRNADNTININWYQKPTASGRIINYYSKHTKRTIINTAKNLINRVLTISDEQFHFQNKLKIKDILINNNFPLHITKSLIENYYKNKHSSRDSQKTDPPKIYKSLIYLPNISERLEKSEIYDKNKYTIAHSSHNTTKSLFTNMKSKIPKMDKHNVVYKIECGGNKEESCGKHYVGTTKNKLKTRMSAHKSDIKLRNNNSIQKTALAEHCKQYNHTPKIDDVRVLQTEHHYNKRLTIEMLHINSLSTTKRINSKADTDNTAYCYRHLTKRDRAICK
ncbi:uncharacterized protein LOC131804256 isoform X2 [Musca domestica]|nr:uncharacterized protein LOC131804256 isoform X2 [Musca domestica]